MNTQKITDNDTYMQRNSRWLMPLIATLILIIGPGLAKSFSQVEYFPSWWAPVAAVAGFFMTGIFAIFTDTLSARIVRVLGNTAAFGIAIWFVIHIFNA